MNRMIVKNRPGDPNITYLYDIAGQPVDINDGGDVTIYSYDRAGRVSDVNDPEQRLVSYEYDSLGLRTKLVYPDDSYITYEYDEMSQLTKIKDDVSNVLAEYQYDELSRRTLLSLGNDANAIYEYDLANRLKKLTNNLDDTNSIVFDYSSYDKVGNRLSMKIDDANAHVYEYDNLYQIISVDYNDGNTTDYYYDCLGNRTSVDDGGPIAYVLNDKGLNQYGSVGGVSYSYDDNGNLTDDGAYLYYYDCENRLTDVNNQSDEPVISYKYDFAGRRVRKIVHGSPDVITKYCYDGDRVIVEYNDSNVALRRFFYGPGIDEPVCMQRTAAGGGAGVFYYHYDGLGSVVAISDDGGQITEKYEYDVFGEPNTTSSIGNPYLFTGRRYDDEIGLYYYRARYYKPDIGRFLQTDPVGYRDSLNLYEYVDNNPVNWVDPFGLSVTVTGGAPVWHTYRNRFNSCPEREPSPGPEREQSPGSVDSVGNCDGDDNPNPWRAEGWNPFHRDQQCYRRSDATGVGGSQCCYDTNGNLVGGSYDWASPYTDWYIPWGGDRWRQNLEHVRSDIWPALRWRSHSGGNRAR